MRKISIILLIHNYIGMLSYGYMLKRTYPTFTVVATLYLILRMHIQRFKYLPQQQIKAIAEFKKKIKLHKHKYILYMHHVKKTFCLQ